MNVQPERMSNRRPSFLFYSARAAVFFGLLASSVLLIAAGASASAYPLNADPFVSCTLETCEILAAGLPIAQQAASAEPQLLALGQPPVQDILKGGDKHAYRVALQAGDFLHVVADQKSIDVVLAISGPDGKDVGTMDSLNGSFGPENVSIIAPVAGTYRIEVRSFDPSAVAGVFAIQITELRPSKPGDEVRVRAEKTYAQGLLGYQGDAEATKAALPVLKSSLQDFQSIGDVHGQAAVLYGLGATHQKLGMNGEVKKELEESIRLFGQAGSPAEAAEVLEALAGFQQSQGESADAEATYRKALDMWSKAIGTEDFEYARINVGLGRVLLGERRYSDAEPYFEKAIAIRETVFGADSLELADALQSYGVTLHDQKKFPEAEKIYRRAIAIRTKVAKPGDEAVLATVINNLAVLFDDQRNYADAEKYYKQSLSIREKALPPGDSEKIATIENLIRIYKDAKKNEQAEALLREALEDVKKANGESSKEAAYRLDALSFFLVDEGKVDESLKNFDLTLAIRKRILDPKDPDIATSTSNIAFAYFKKQDYAPAITLEKEAIQLYEADNGANAPGISDHYSFLATLYYRSEKYDDAIAWQNKALTSLQNAKSPDIRTIGVATNNLGLFMKGGEKYKEAIEKFQASIEMLVKAKDRANEAIARHNLGNTYEADGQYPAAQEAYRQAVIILQELHDKANEADTLLDLAGVLARQRQTGPALDTYRSALAIESELNDRGMQAYALNGIGDLYKTANQYDQATETYLKAVAIREDLYPNSNGLAETFTNLADVYKAQGKYADAEAPLRRALEIREKNAGANGDAVVLALNNLAAVLNSEGKFPEAEPLFRRAISIQEKKLGADNPKLAGPLSNLASLYADQGQYAEAGPLYRAALKLLSAATEANRSQIVDLLNGLSAVYRAEGRYLDAARSLSQAIAIEEKTPGTDPSSLADSYSTLAELYKTRHQYVAGAEAAEHALKLLEQDQGKTTALYAKTLDSVADFYELQGKHDDAAKFYSSALEIQTKFSGKDSPDLALTADSLAEVYLAQYKTQEAEPLLLRALAIREKVFGPNHPRTSDTVQDLAVLYYYEGNRSKAQEFFHRREDTLRAQLSQSLPAMSDKDRNTLLNSVQDFFPNAYSFAYANREGDPGTAARMYDLALWQKAVSLSSFTSARHRATAGSDPEATALLEQLASKRSQLAAFFAQKHPDTAEWRAAEEKLADESMQLEREYSRRLGSHPPAPAIVQPTLSDIRKHLHEGEAAVEYLRFDFADAEARASKPLYVALVLTTDVNSPTLVTLGDAATLEAEPLRAYHSSLAPAAHPDSSKFYEAFWKPIESALGGATRVYISPDGALNEVAFGAVTEGDHKVLLEKYDLHMLPSTRDLVRAAAPRTDSPANTAVCLGNPDFALSETQYRSALAAIDAVAKGMPAPALPSAPPAADTKTILARLPDSGAEVQSISKMLQEKNWQVQLYEGPLAVEEAIRGAHSPRVLHIATSGFYLPQPEGGDAQSANEIPAGLDDPSLRAGIFFAGADAALSGVEPPPDVEDGILSAYESAGLDLNGTELVVLNTSAGKIDPKSAREAIYGMPRAMLRAGAATVLISLWPMSDKESAELAELFYKHWLTGEDKWTALRKAELETRAKIIKSTGKDDPSKWASWVLVGH
jgi:tetratricopeptide (TPR) repeat protein/CHAT domain-containing protein